MTQFANDSKIRIVVPISRLDKKTFEEIQDDPKYYEVIEFTRFYNFCQRCGFIPLSRIDHNTKYLDVHCKCGCFVTYIDYTEEYLNQLKYDKKMSDLMSFD